MTFCVQSRPPSAKTALSPIWLAYPNDEKALRIIDQYMWGDQILVAPVLEQGATVRRVYLPAGEWWDFWSNQRARSDEGSEIRRELDLSTIPLYVLAGAILPLGPMRQYATEPSEEPVTLQVYPGADGQFSWYQDDGISFAYRHGQFLRIDYSWQDPTRKLTLATSGGNLSSLAMKVIVRAMDNGTTKTISLTHPLAVIDP